MESRLAVVESKIDALTKSVARLEDKIDVLSERTARQGAKLTGLSAIISAIVAGLVDVVKRG
jgi:uncharacterized coiled-coil protein SlyX